MVRTLALVAASLIFGLQIGAFAAEKVKITSPTADTEVRSPLRIEWSPNRLMTVEIRHDDEVEPLTKQINQPSGKKYVIAKPGRTEIKIWVEGASEPSDVIWVNVKEKSSADIQITQPAEDTLVKTDFKLSWQPANKKLTVGFYQNEALLMKIKNVPSGQEFTLGKPGKTEIKVWVEGEAESAESVWVAVAK